MTGRRFVLLIAVLVLNLAGPPAAAVTTPSGIDPRLRLEWDASQTRGGRPMVAGYIYNALFTKMCSGSCIHAVRRRRRVAVAFRTLSRRYS